MDGWMDEVEFSSSKRVVSGYVKKGGFRQEEWEEWEEWEEVEEWRDEIQASHSRLEEEEGPPRRENYLATTVSSFDDLRVAPPGRIRGGVIVEDDGTAVHGRHSELSAMKEMMEENAAMISGVVVRDGMMLNIGRLWW